MCVCCVRSLASKNINWISGVLIEKFDFQSWICEIRSFRLRSRISRFSYVFLNDLRLEYSSRGLSMSSIESWSFSEWDLSFTLYKVQSRGAIFSRTSRILLWGAVIVSSRLLLWGAVEEQSSCD